MKTATITKTELIDLIASTINEFETTNISDDTTVFVNKTDYADVEVEDSTFNTFTAAHATPAWFLLNTDTEPRTVSRPLVREWVESVMDFD